MLKLPPAEALSDKQLELLCAEKMAKGSKSFAFASQLFGVRIRRGALALYAWCRAVDDAVDQQPDRALQAKTLDALEHETKRAFSGLPNAELSYVAVSRVAEKHQVPVEYALDLLEGMRMDVEGRRYQSLSDLRRYCYCVAGAVGLQMTHVMGVSDRAALDQAVELGIAMQLTNIARDVIEDARMGRVYLPADWLREEGLVAEPEVVVAVGNRERVYRVVERVLAAAERSYAIGRRGVRFLPLRAAIAVAVAGSIYRGIGLKILRTGPEYLNGRRVFTTKAEKWMSLLGALMGIMLWLPSRLVRPWRAISLDGVLWRMA